MPDKLNNQIINNSLIRRPVSPFIDKEGNELGSISFDVNSLFKGANTVEKTREKILSALRFLEKKCKDNPDLKKICQDLHRLIHNKNDSADILLKYTRDLNKIECELSPIIEEGSEKSIAKGVDYNSTTERYDLIITLIKLIHPHLKKQLEVSSKKVLQHSESGNNKYPEKHSFFATATQEVSSGNNSKLIASEIKKGCSIEEALLNCEKNYSVDTAIPQMPTHRLSNSATKDKASDFEIFFVTGSPYESEAVDKFSKSEKRLADAIKKTHGSKCKKISSLKKLTVEDFENSVKKLAERVKKNDIKKLYIFYNGHGDREGIQEGVSLKNGKKQGAEKFLFVLDSDNELTEEKMKEIYNKHLKDIEVISVFDSCNSGAAITANENENKLNILA